MSNVAEAKEHGEPVHVPGGQVKGWNYKGDFVKNPDFVPPKVTVEPHKPQTYMCGECGQEVDNKRNQIMRGLSVIVLCPRCMQKYGK